MFNTKHGCFSPNLIHLSKMGSKTNMPVAAQIIPNKNDEIAIDQLKEVGGLNCKFFKTFKQQSITFKRDVIKLMAFVIQSTKFYKTCLL